MHGTTGWRLVLVLFVGLTGSHGARAQDIATMLKGKWTTEGGDCTKYITLGLTGNTLQITDAAGHADMERVIARRATGFATQVVRSSHGFRVGSRIVYEMLAPSQLSLTDAATGRSAGNLVRCPDPLPADATPQQVVQTIYARYASPGQTGMPFESEAALRQFFAPELADRFMAWMGVSGLLPDGCKGNYDPFVPDFNDGLGVDDGLKGADAVQAGKVSVSATPIPPDATEAVVHVSVGDLGKPGEITVSLDRTPAGWRIGDVVPASGLSFRADMAACTAPQPKPPP